MTEKFSCPQCEQVRDFELIDRDETATIKGRDIAFKAHLYQCATCGEGIETPAQLDANLDAAREAYARLYEAPTPDQIVALRARYGASQKAFGMILGFGELTINTYEQGATPDSANRLLLKLAENPAIFKSMYEINSSRIGALQRQRIETSAGFKSAKGWEGLEALAETLTPTQRVKIEQCADCYGQSVQQQISGYVSAGSFRDYSQIALQPTWTDRGPMTKLEQKGQASRDDERAAS